MQLRLSIGEILFGKGPELQKRIKIAEVGAYEGATDYSPDAIRDTPGIIFVYKKNQGKKKGESLYRAPLAQPQGFVILNSS